MKQRTFALFFRHCYAIAEAVTWFHDGGMVTLRLFTRSFNLDHVSEMRLPEEHVMMVTVPHDADNASVCEDAIDMLSKALRVLGCAPDVAEYLARGSFERWGPERAAAERDVMAEARKAPRVDAAKVKA